MNNLQNELNELRKNNAAELSRKERELEIKVKLLELTGVKFSVMIHEYKNGDHTSIWAENSNHEKQFDRAQIETYYNQLCTMFKPCPAALKFVGKEYNNAAPVKITVENNTADIVFNHPQRAIIEFTFESEVRVQFKMPVHPYNGFFSPTVLTTMQYVGKPENKRDRQEKTMYKITGFNVVNVSGNSYVTYTEDKGRVNELMNIAFTGNVREKITIEQLENILSSGDFCLMSTAHLNFGVDEYAHSNKIVMRLYPPTGSTIIEKDKNICRINTAYKLLQVDSMKESEYDELYSKYGEE